MNTAAQTTYEHIALDDQGIPWIAGANTKVVELVAEVQAYGWSPAELHFQHPHLTMGQIHSALAYYWDHQEMIDNDLQTRRAAADSLRKDLETSSILQRLRPA